MRDVVTRNGERPICRGIRESAELIGVSSAFIRKLIAAGQLKSFRMGRRVLIKDVDLMALLDAGQESHAS